MTKNEFFKNLKNKLNILENNEVEDIINEYKDIVQEKIKSGKSEKEAIEEFGDLDELSTEILKAYKINTKKIDEKEESFESRIKKFSENTAEFVNEKYSNFKESNEDFGLETLIELIVKFILFLIFLIVLQLPFHFIVFLGSSIFSNFGLLYELFNLLWKFLVWITYLITCGLSFVVAFKPYFYKEIKKESKTKNEKKNNEEAELQVKEQPKKKIKREKSDKSNMTFFVNILKLFLILTVQVPLIFTLIGFVIAVAFTFAGIIIGINFFGLLILLIGFVLGTSWLLNVFDCLILQKRSIKSIPIFIAVFLIATGTFLFVFELSNYEFVDGYPDYNKNLKTFTKELEVEGYKNIHSHNADVVFEIDEEIADGKAVFSIEYNPKYHEVHDIYDHIIDNHINLDVSYLYNFEFNDEVKMIIDGLKDKKFYNRYTPYPQITVTLNSNTKEALEIPNEA